MEEDRLQRPSTLSFRPHAHPWQPATAEVRQKSAEDTIARLQANPPRPQGDAGWELPEWFVDGGFHTLGGQATWAAARPPPTACCSQRRPPAAATRRYPQVPPMPQAAPPTTTHPTK